MKKLLILFFFIMSVSGVSASFDFPADYNVSYTYSESGPTLVNQHVVLTNRLSQIYPTSYQLTLSGNSPKNITARDSKGPLKFKIISQDEHAITVEFAFNNVVVGKGKTLSFDVNYEVDPATPVGETYEIILPQTKNLDTGDTYKLNLYVPTSYGPPISLSPHPTLIANPKNPLLAHFAYDGADLAQKESVAIFGQNQLPHQIEVLPPWQIFPPFFTKLKVSVTNPNPTSFTARTLALTSQHIQLKGQVLIIPKLAPDQRVILDIPLQTWFVPSLEPKSITLKLDRESITYNVPDKLFVVWYAIFIVIIITALIGSGFFTHKAGSLHLQKRKR